MVVDRLDLNWKWRRRRTIRRPPRPPGQLFDNLDTPREPAPFNGCATWGSLSVESPTGEFPEHST